METILDTNFIISCITKKIDFIEELKTHGFTIVVPREVLNEMKDLRTNCSRGERSAIDVGLKILGVKEIKKTKLGHKKVDEGLIEKGKLGIFIATLDNGIRRQIPNKIGINAASKGLIVERD